jgi:hypothetical protein
VVVTENAPHKTPTWLADIDHWLPAETISQVRAYIALLLFFLFYYFHLQQAQLQLHYFHLQQANLLQAHLPAERTFRNVPTVLGVGSATREEQKFTESGRL